MTRRQITVAHLLAADAGHSWAKRFSRTEASKVSVEKMTKVGFGAPVEVQQGFVTGYKKTQHGWVQWDIFSNGDLTLHFAPLLEGKKASGKAPDVIVLTIKNGQLTAFDLFPGFKLEHYNEILHILKVLRIKLENLTVVSRFPVTLTLEQLFHPAYTLLSWPLRGSAISPDITAAAS
jgi:hypothetical protein